MAGHYKHVEEVEGLETQCTAALQEYGALVPELERLHDECLQCTRDSCIEEALAVAENKIAAEYNKLLEDIAKLEARHLSIVQNSRFLEKLQDEKASLEEEKLTDLADFDRALEGLIRQLLEALVTEDYNSVKGLVAEQNLKQITKRAKQFQGLYDKLSRYRGHLDMLRAVKPKIAFDSKILDALILVKGVNEDTSRLRIFDADTHSVYLIAPKEKIIDKHKIEEVKLPKKHAQVVLSDETLLLCGGRHKGHVYSKSACLYLETTHKIAFKSQMGEERACHGIANRKDVEVYVAGGENKGGLLSSAEVYDVATDVWKPLPRLTERKKNLGLCVVCDLHLYAVGGFISAPLKTIEVLHVLDGRDWELRAVKDFVPRHKLGLFVINDTQLLIFGGKCKSKHPAHSHSYSQPQSRSKSKSKPESKSKSTTEFSLRTELYDTLKGIIVEKGSLAKPGSFHRSDTKRVEDMVYASSNTTAATHVYNLKANQWSIIEEKHYTLRVEGK